MNAVTVEHVSKKFLIPHERITTLKGAFVHLFHKKTYVSFHALNDVSFSIEKGECFGIIGKNGSGKSTLLKILAGVYVPDHGRIELHGHVSPFLELGIGFNPELSGRDNVYLNATVLGMSKVMIDTVFDAIVSFSEIGKFIDQKLKNYSSGMQLRLAFSVAVHANRDILLMDEILAVGDTNFQAKCIREILRLKREGKTIILVTHDNEAAQNHCDRVLYLNQGDVIAIGNPHEVVEQYLKDTQ